MRKLIVAVALATLSTSTGGIMSAQSAAGTTAARNKAIVEASLKAWADGTGSPTTC